MKYLKLFESMNLKYFGQCDLIRKQPGGEEFWQEMMLNKKEITKEEFLRILPNNLLQELLDGETLEEFTSDPDRYFAKSIVKGEVVYFLATHGFEFIWK